MSRRCCKNCPAISIAQWKIDGNWHLRYASIYELESNVLLSEDSRICVIFASANEIRTCQPCRLCFSEVFSMPEFWWSEYCQNSNGYLGCELTKDGNVITGYNTWVYFEIKHLDDKPRFQDELRYRWHKINTFTRLIASTQQTIVIVFDAQPPIVGCILSPLLEPDLKASVDPFWVYSRLAGEVVRLEDSAVWAIRNHVRAIETERKPPGKPQPDYRRLHDIARHAIHVSETLDVAVETMDGILAQHDDFLGLDFPVTPPPKRGASNNTRRHLLFCKKMLRSLRHRANSNKERLQNEIQLAFNTVAQYDAGTSVEIGRASQIDSAAMKTIAFLTMAFLPATFFSAIFSMSFFDYDADSDLWRVSSKFWVYWAFAIPATLATFTLWYFWHRAFPPTSPGT